MSEVKPREFWIREWTDSQPDGFLSGNVKHGICHDTYTKPMAEALHVVEMSALVECQEKLKEANFWKNKFENVDKLKAANELIEELVLTLQYVADGGYGGAIHKALESVEKYKKEREI